MCIIGWWRKAGFYSAKINLMQVIQCPADLDPVDAYSTAHKTSNFGWLPNSIFFQNFIFIRLNYINLSYLIKNSVKRNCKKQDILNLQQSIREILIRKLDNMVKYLKHTQWYFQRKKLIRCARILRKQSKNIF